MNVDSLDPFGVLSADPYGVLGGVDSSASPVIPSALEFEDIIGVSRPVQVADNGTCATCGATMRTGSCDLEDVCDSCGLVAAGDTSALPDVVRAPPVSARLRVVGAGSNWLQPDLYRSDASDTTRAQKRQVLEEYKVYRQSYIDEGGRAFPLDACQLAAEYYNGVQKLCVKRSQNKKAIMAACFRSACIGLGIAPSRTEIAAFMQLPGKGIASGSNFIRALVAEGKLDIDIDADPSRPEITTLFALQGMEGSKYDGLQEAVYKIVQTATDRHIGINSTLRSKIVGASFAVLSRCSDPRLVPTPPSLAEFCRNAKIRKNTLERFISELGEYHSHFEAIYREAGLEAKPFSALRVGIGGSAISRTSHSSTIRSPDGA